MRSNESPALLRLCRASTLCLASLLSIHVQDATAIAAPATQAGLRTDSRRASTDDVAESGGATTTTRDLGETSAAAVREFSFIHMSDTHVEAYLTSAGETLQGERSYDGIRSIAELGSVEMPPFSLTAPRPAFAIVTGDCTEFGYPGVTADVVDSYFKDLGMPVYLSTGNHDNTQVAMPEYWRKRFGGQNYSFDSHGCRFIVLNSASLQDPHPSFGEEVVTFLKENLKTVRASTPVFVAFHHPLTSGEFASAYDTDRVTDVLRTHNVALILVGHGHSPVTFDFDGLDGVMGGSTFVASKQKAGADGYGVCYVKGDKIHYAYRPFNESGAVKRLLEKEIPADSDYPAISFNAPAAGAGVKGDRLLVAVGTAGTSGTLTDAQWNLDDETTGMLKVDGQALYAAVDTSRLDWGAHYLRAVFRDSSGREFRKSTVFYKEPEAAASRSGKTRPAGAAKLSDPATSSPPRAKWRFPLGAASKSTPVISDGRVFVGANDGIFRAVDAESGKLRWSFDAKAEILTRPVRFKDLVIFGAGDGFVHALHASTGKPAWKRGTGAAVYSSPVLGPDGDLVFGNNNAELISLDAATGEERWRNTEAQYAVEAAPLIDGDRVYFGAWDGMLYCADRKSGQTLWKTPSAKNQEKTSRYYAPADASPVAAGGRVYAADRGYLAGVFDASTGDFSTTVSQDVTALALADKGSALYSRGTKTPFSKIRLDGTPLWESDFVAGRIPAPPVEAGGTVYVCSDAGMLFAVDAASGSTLWKYRVTPRLYVMSPPAVADGTVYIVGADGVLTAIDAP